MKVIVFNNELGEIVRAGLYDSKGKWLKWIPKKQLDKYIEDCEELENKNTLTPTPPP